MVKHELVSRWEQVEETHQWISGYGYVEKAPEGQQILRGRFLTPATPVMKRGQQQEPGGLRVYAPREAYNVIFRKFADLATARSEAAFLEQSRVFANTHGLLTNTMLPYGYLEYVLPCDETGHFPEPKPTFDDVYCGEQLGWWKKETTEMHHALLLWDMLRSANPVQQLQRVIRWGVPKDSNLPTFDPTGTWKHRGQWNTIVSLLVEPRVLGPHEIERAAWCQIQIYVNRRLHRWTSWSLNTDYRSPSVLLQCGPLNLLGGIWLQFARTVDGEIDYRKCAHCGAPFATGPTEKRNKKAEYCTESCRVRACQKRKAAQSVRATQQTRRHAS